MDYYDEIAPEETMLLVFARHPGPFIHSAREDSYVEEEEEEEVEEFDEDDLADLEDIYVRSKFFETWLWTDIRLPSVTKSDG